MLVTVDGLQFHCVQDGQGSDLILIHGLGGSLHDWDACTPFLSHHTRLAFLAGIDLSR